MSIALTYRGEVQNGQILIYRPWHEDFAKNVKRLEGKEIILVITRWRRKRTHPQNNYYWGVVIEILSDLFGYEPEETHEALLAQHSRLPGNGPGMPERILRTSRMTTVQFINYIDKIKRWALLEFGVVIPEPNEVHLDNS